MTSKYSNKEYPNSDLTEKIIGILFDIYNELGFGYPEKFYQRALAYRLTDHNVAFKREQYGLVKIDDRPIGRYFVDFVIDRKVAVELKVANEFFDSHMQQILSYLEAEKIKIGLLCLITPKGIKIKRLIK